jgi:hypothetical protein
LIGPVPFAGQFVSLIAGSVVVLMTALLAEAPGEAFGSARLPLLAGAVAAMTPQLWQSSHVVMADTTALALATTGMWALVRHRSEPENWPWFILATVGLSGAVLTRWAYALLIPVAVVLAAANLARVDRRRAVAQMLAGAGICAALLWPLLVNAWSLFAAAGSSPAYVVDLQVYRWSPTNALRTTFLTADGQLSYRFPNGVYYALAPGHRYLFTPLLAPLLLPGLWSLWRRGGRLQFFLLAGWLAMSTGFLAGAPYQNFRFNLAHLPPLAILVAAGWCWLWVRLRGYRRWFIAAWLAGGLVWMAFGGLSLTRWFAERKAEQLSLVRWAEARMPIDARLITFQLTGTFRHYGAPEVLELFHLETDEIANLLMEKNPVYLLVDESNVGTQWTGLAPERNFSWMREQTELIQLGQRSGYTLFLVLGRNDKTQRELSPLAAHRHPALLPVREPAWRWVQRRYWFCYRIGSLSLSRLANTAI